MKIYQSKKAKYKTTKSGYDLLPEHWQYFTVYYHGNKLFNKTFKNRIWCNTGYVLHVLGFRFTYGYEFKNEQ